MRVYRATISNIRPDFVFNSYELGDFFSIKGISTTEGFGFYYDPDFGFLREPNTTIEIASKSLDNVLPFIVELLERAGEKFAYFTIDGAIPKLLGDDGIFYGIEKSPKSYAGISKSHA